MMSVLLHLPWLPSVTLPPPPTPVQICREAEAAIFHQQLFEELRRLTPLSSDPTEVTAIGAVESSFKCCAGAIIVLTSSGRCVQSAFCRPSQATRKRLTASDDSTNDHSSFIMKNTKNVALFIFPPKSECRVYRFTNVSAII